MRLAALCAALAIVLPGLAQAEVAFSMQNATGYPIRNIFFSKARAGHWSPNQLDHGSLGDGQSVDFYFPLTEEACRWDIKIIYEDSGVSVLSNIDLCQVTRMSVTWDNAAGKTRYTTE